MQEFLSLSQKQGWFVCKSYPADLTLLVKSINDQIYVLPINDNQIVAAISDGLAEFVENEKHYGHQGACQIHNALYDLLDMYNNLNRLSIKAARF